MSALDASSKDRTWIRAFVTPEGVDLRLKVATMSQRVSAFMIDVFIILATLVGLTLVCLLGLIGGHNQLTGTVIFVIWLLGYFVLVNGYFLFYEMGSRGATPGKRVMKLRVAARDGGALSATAIFARNAMRQIEIILPLGFLVVHGQGVDAILIMLGVVWTGIFALFPLFNRDRLRAGDLVAGTWVVTVPERRLLPDMAVATISQSVASRFTFSPGQLDAYGVKELQVLEDVLRRCNMETVRTVAERIRAKIAWAPHRDESDLEFLDAYYAALRQRLEQLMLLGRRKEDKHDRS